MYPKDKEVHTVSVTHGVLLPGPQKLLFLESISMAPGGRMYVFLADMGDSPVLTAAEAGLTFDEEKERWYFIDEANG